jgi:cell division protein FtsI (penicillin-binding protein 3)
VNKFQHLYSFNLRLLVFVGVLALGFAAVLGRMFYLQVWRGDYFAQQARIQQQRTVKLEPRRGKIVDHNGRILAVSVPVPSVYADPSEVKNPEQTARALAPLLKEPQRTLLRKLRSGRSFVWLSRQVLPERARQVEALKLPGVHFQQEYRRIYPNGPLAGAVLGYTGIDIQGLEGLEAKYHGLLAGEEVSYVVEADARRRPLPRQEKAQPKEYDLHLTLDSRIQYIAEQALKQGVKATKAKRGSAIVMESRTGAIWAMATYPGFDPNRFSEFDRGLRINPSVTLGYDPGSTLKVVTLAAALNENLITPDQQFFCENGKYRVGNRTINDSTPQGVLTVSEVLQKSSNICAAKIGMLMPKLRFHQYLEAFGLGQRPGSGLPGEAPGLLNAPGGWTEVDHANISFGQGVTTSPLQVLNAINVIANGGEWVQPHIVDHARDREGQRVDQVEDEAQQYQMGPGARHQVVSREVAEIVTDYMVTVTQKGGTAPNAAIPGYSVAGKTGTSQIYDPKLRAYSKHRFWASFAGFVPAEDPLVSILVVVEEPAKGQHYGSHAAAPAFREIAQRTLILHNNFPAPELPEAPLPNVASRNMGSAAEGDSPVLESVGMDLAD